MESPQEPQQSILIQWLAINAQWLWAATLGLIVRCLRMLSKGNVPIRQVVTESLLIFFVIFGGAGILQSYFNVSDAASGGIGVMAGLVGAEALRTELISRLKNALSAFNQGDKK